MISVRRLPKERRYEVRLHHMFADADPVITRALARYITITAGGVARARRLHRSERRPRPRRGVAADAGQSSRRRAHDLKHVFDELNTRYFENKIDRDHVGCALPPAAPPQLDQDGTTRSRSPDPDSSLSRRALCRSSSSVIVFHEMLHQVHDIRVRRPREFHSRNSCDEAM